MDNANQFFKNFFGSLILISQPSPSPSSTISLPSSMASPAEFSTEDSPALPPRNDAPIADVWKGTWRDHAAVLIPDPGYFVAGGLAGVASRKLLPLVTCPLTCIQATRSVLLHKHMDDGRLDEV
jgi:solute carrier family 25 phosphate transporter 23/24/25/41